MNNHGVVPGAKLTRLEIAAMILQGFAACPSVSFQEGKPLEDVVKTAIEATDYLLAQLEKKAE